jgi:iron(III) transport system ATP-binding protein
MVFQSYALLPHYNVFDNVAYGLKLRKVPKDEIKERVTRILELVELSGMEARMTNQLSGGQQQRVALARALVLEPGVLLFDEPLSNLDAKLRVSMRTEIRRIQQATGITAIYVTHDQSEAMALSDSIIIMNKGVVAQIGSPQEIYYHPNSEFVADFIGEANFLKGKCVALEDGCGVLQLADTQVRVAATENMTVGEDYTIVLRPESAGLVPEGNLKCRVVLSCFMGAYQNYHGKADGLQPEESSDLSGWRDLRPDLRAGRRACAVNQKCKNTPHCHYGGEEYLFIYYFRSCFRSSSGVVMGAMPKFSTR